MVKKVKLSEKIVPTREDRLGTIISYGGRANELVDLAARRCLKAQDRLFTQTTFCQEWLAIFTLATITDAVSIVRAPVGCSSSLSCINIFNRCVITLGGRGLGRKIAAKIWHTLPGKPDSHWGNRNKLIFKIGRCYARD